MIVNIGACETTVDIIDFTGTKDPSIFNVGDTGTIRFRFKYGYQIVNKN